MSFQRASPLAGFGAEPRPSLSRPLAHRIRTALAMSCQPTPISFMAKPEFQIFVMWLILSPVNCII